MRVLLVAVLVGSAHLTAACSDAGDVSIRRSPSRDTASSAPAGSPATSTQTQAPPASPASPASTPQPDPAPATPAPVPTTTPAPPPATPPAPGSCGNPKCFAAGGFGGCKATDGTGATVTMGCEDGGCACFAGGQNTAAFEGDPNSSDDAAQLFLTNCGCL